MNKFNSHDKPQSADENVGRRRFVRGVGIAVPVALTVSARSALAGVCTTQSAAASIALANSHNATGDVGPQPCVGVTSSSLTNNLPGANVIFNARTAFGSGPKQKMLKVAQDTSDTFAQCIATAYINSMAGKVTTKSYTVQNLKDMWDKGPKIAYQPVPGVYWGKQQIIDYLKPTWTL